MTEFNASEIKIDEDEGVLLSWPGESETPAVLMESSQGPDYSLESYEPDESPQEVQIQHNSNRLKIVEWAAGAGALLAAGMVVGRIAYSRRKPRKRSSRFAQLLPN